MCMSKCTRRRWLSGSDKSRPFCGRVRVTPEGSRPFRYEMRGGEGVR